MPLTPTQKTDLIARLQSSRDDEQSLPVAAFDAGRKWAIQRATYRQIKRIGESEVHIATYQDLLSALADQQWQTYIHAQPHALDFGFDRGLLSTSRCVAEFVAGVREVWAEVSNDLLEE